MSGNDPMALDDSRWYFGYVCRRSDGCTPDPIAQGAESEDFHDCEHTSLQHGADGCNVPGCLCAFMSWDESAYDR